MSLRVVLEVAPKLSFASALDWPGWSRGAKTPDGALDALLAYAPRYSAVASRAKLTFRPPKTIGGLEIVERLHGDAATEFGVPRTAASSENAPLSARDLERLATLLQACWWVFDQVAARAVGVELTLGPRGGGRHLEKIIGHVRDGEAAYLTKLGSRAPSASEEAPDGPMTLLRHTFMDAVTARATGQPVASPSRTKTLWSPRYGLRRAAWHVMDHAWEIEDRSG